MEDEVMTMSDLPVMPDRVGLLESKLRAAEDKVKWMMVLLWILFVLFILGAAGLFAWNAWQNEGMRRSLSDNTQLLDKRMDNAADRTNASGAERVKPIEARLDMILQQLSSLQADVGGIKVRQDMLQNYFPYQQPTK